MPTARSGMYDYGFFSYESKADFLRRSEEFWNPHKTRFWAEAGIDLVIDRREGYLFWDMAGRRLIDLHLNGGTFNLSHGHAGLALGTGDDRFSTLFLSDRPEEFTQVPFNDLGAMEDALRGNDVAAVIIESIPATYGFPLPEPGYLQAVKRLCEQYGALYIADEVQTGLMRTGEMWAIAKAGIQPDIIVIGKGITGGM